MGSAILLLMPPSVSLALTHALHLGGLEAVPVPILDTGKLCGAGGGETGVAASASRQGCRWGI